MNRMPDQETIHNEHHLQSLLRPEPVVEHGTLRQDTEIMVLNSG